MLTLHVGAHPKLWGAEQEGFPSTVPEEAA